MTDLKFAIRQLLKNPGFTAVAVITLALGIGANTAMFSFLNSLLLRPPPFPRSDELVRVFRATPEVGNGDLSPADFLDLQRESAGIGRFAAYERSNATLDDYERPTPWVRITPGLFSVLEVLPELGRDFRSDEAISGNEHVALISYWFWQDRFDGARDVIGRTLRSGGELYEVVGVMPPSATDHRLFNQVDVFSPLTLDGAMASDRHTHRLSVLGRPAGNVSADQAGAFLAAFGSRLASDFPTENSNATLRSEGLPKAGMSPTGRAILWMLLGLSGFVLLIACSNLANMLLARTIERSRELAVRAALGAARGQLLRPLICEALTLSLIGGLGALFVSRWTTDWLHSIIWNNGGPTIDFSLDSRVLIFDLAVSIATILFFGVGPAMVALRVRATEALKSGARGSTPGRHQQRLTRWLIAGQFALAMILLSGAGFFVRGAINILGQDYGWSSKGVVQCQVGLPPDVYSDGERISAFQRQLIEQVKSVPGVESASICGRLPFLGFRSWTRYVPEHGEFEKGQEPQVFLNDITPDYFAVTSTRLLSGRAFNGTDSATSPKVVIINETMARTFFPNEDPVGKRVAQAGAETPEWAEIIGLVADAHSADVADKPVTYQLYRPMAQNPASTFILAARTSGAPVQPVIGAMQSAIVGLDPKLEIHELMTSDQMIAQLTSQFDMVRHLLIGFAGLGLFLATIGIYGMIARMVAQHTGEIGLRMALGAQVGDVVRLVLGFGVRVAMVGAGIGVLGALGLSRLLASVLPAMQTNPVFVVLGATVLLVTLAAAASWLPTRRASKIHPMEALRSE